MKQRLYLLTLTVVFLITGTSLAKNDANYDDEFQEAIEWAWKGNFSPFVEGSLGKSMIKHLSFDGVMPENTLTEIKLGYSQVQKYERTVWEMDERFVFGSYSSDKKMANIDIAPGDFNALVRRFGFGNRLGYGYRLGPVTLMPYNQNGLVWTDIRTTRPVDMSEKDNSILDRYEGVYRFGMHAEGGIKLQLFESFSVVGSYEVAVIYPRHIFWEWLGSYIIMSAGVGAVSVFAEDILDSSPVLGPVFYFLLKNGISYAFYQGVKEKMNWPFTSETPITSENMKLGISFSF